MPFPQSSAQLPAREPSTAPSLPASPPLDQLLDGVARLVAGVLAGRSLSDLLPTVAPAQRAATQALSFYVLRHLGWAQEVRAGWVQKKPPAWVDALVLSSLCLLRAARAHANLVGASPEPDAPRYSPHTVVDQSVRAAKRHAAPQAKMVNALLRRYLREADALDLALQSDELALWNHPRWWVERLRRDWPQAWQGILQAGNQRARSVLRINARWGDAQTYQAHLQGQGIAARIVGPHALVLADSVPVARLPGFEAGWLSVQDSHAQLAAPLLLGGAGQDLAERLPSGARVLDACCAPGGKTAHLLELADLDVLGLDVDAQRLGLVKNNLDRLHLHAELKVADARQVQSWWDGRAFDAILLDAPCSASGIVRRHPDIRWLRRESDVAALAQTQDQLLDALWPLLKPGGRLLYCTCSVFRQEGVDRIDAFLQRTVQAIDAGGPGHMLPVADNGGEGSASPSSSTPAASTGAGDGFYYALLAKR